MLFRSTPRKRLKLWLFKLHLWMVSRRKMWKSRGEKCFYGRLSNQTPCLTKSSKDWNKAESAQRVRRRKKPSEAANSIWWTHDFSWNSVCVWFYTLHCMNTHTHPYAITKKKKKKIEGAACEAVICQPQGWGQWANLKELHPSTRGSPKRSRGRGDSQCPAHPPVGWNLKDGVSTARTALCLMKTASEGLRTECLFDKTAPSFW